MNKKIYCISGLGADEKIFVNLRLKGYELKYIPWLVPLKMESISEYAGRMAARLDDESPIILGVSFGGMVGIEIAKQIPVKRLIIVSSIKSTMELPSWMKVAGSLRLHKLLPVRSNRFTEKIDNSRLGVTTKEEKEMVRVYRREVDPVYFNWAIHQVLKWKNDWQPEHIIHIHGDKDRIFPVKKLKPNYVIKNGTHMMIYNKAAEIGEYLEKII